MALDVTVSGVDSLAAKLAAASGKVRQAAVDTVAAETEAVAEDMRAAAPVATGELREGIVTSHDDLVGRATSTARHSVFVEFGTSSAAAQPFVVPTAEQHRHPYRKRMVDAINQELGSL